MTNNNILTWRVINLTLQKVGEGAIFVAGYANPDMTFAGGHFIASIANPSEGIIASFATGTVNQTIDGYTLQCSDQIGGTAVFSAKLSIPGKLQLETNTSQSFQINVYILSDIQMSPPSRRT